MKTLATAITVSALCGSLVATSATHAAAFDPVASHAQATPALAAADFPLPRLRRLIGQERRLVGDSFPQVTFAGSTAVGRAGATDSEASLDIGSAAASAPMVRAASPTCMFQMGCGPIVIYPSPQAAPAGGEPSLDVGPRVSP